MKKHAFWNWLDGASLALLVLAMCGQIIFKSFGRDTLKEGLGFASKTFALDFSDLAFALVTLFFVLRVVQLRAWKRLWWPPLACWALLFAMAISALHSPALAKGIGAGGLRGKEVIAALAELVQWGGYFLVAPWVLVNLLFDRRAGEPIARRSLAITTLGLAALLNCSAALTSVNFSLIFLYLLSLVRGAPAQWSELMIGAPQGLFASPNVYCAFLAIVAPLLLEAESDDDQSAASRKLGLQGRARLTNASRKLQRMVTALGVLVAAALLFTGVSLWATLAFFHGPHHRRPDARQRAENQGLPIGVRGGVRSGRAHLVARARPIDGVSRTVFEVDRCKPAKSRTSRSSSSNGRSPRATTRRAKTPFATGLWAGQLPAQHRAALRLRLDSQREKDAARFQQFVVSERRCRWAFWDWAPSCGWWRISGCWRGARRSYNRRRLAGRGRGRKFERLDFCQLFPRARRPRRRIGGGVPVRSGGRRFTKRARQTKRKRALGVQCDEETISSSVRSSVARRVSSLFAKNEETRLAIRYYERVRSQSKHSS